MMTILQQAIDELKKLIPDTQAPNDYEFGKTIAYENAVDILEYMLPVEEKQIRDAWKDGFKTADVLGQKNDNADQYITQLKS